MGLGRSMTESSDSLPIVPTHKQALRLCSSPPLPPLLLLRRCLLKATWVSFTTKPSKVSSRVPLAQPDTANPPTVHSPLPPNLNENSLWNNSTLQTLCNYLLPIHFLFI